MTRPILKCLPLVLLPALFGCRTNPSIGYGYDTAGFVEPPVVIERDGHYYLRYRRGLDNGRFTPANPVLRATRRNDGGYYYFSVPISHMEWGNRVERPLALDGLEDFARARRIYWLDSDGRKHPLPIRPE